MSSVQNAGVTSGGSVTISGLSFGDSVFTPTASIATADLCSSTAWTSATTVACAPQAYGGSAAMRTAVSVSALAGTLTGQFSFDGACACAAAVGKTETRGRRRIDSLVARIAALWLWQRRA